MIASALGWKDFKAPSYGVQAVSRSALRGYSASSSRRGQDPGLVLARLRHSHYVRREPARHTGEPNPSPVAWERLPPTLKESNRAFACEIREELVASHCSLARRVRSMDDEVAPYDEHEIRIHGTHGALSAGCELTVLTRSGCQVIEVLVEGESAPQALEGPASRRPDASDRHRERLPNLLVAGLRVCDEHSEEPLVTRGEPRERRPQRNITVRLKERALDRRDSAVARLGQVFGWALASQLTPSAQALTPGRGRKPRPHPGGVLQPVEVLGQPHPGCLYNVGAIGAGQAMRSDDRSQHVFEPSDDFTPSLRVAHPCEPHALLDPFLDGSLARVAPGQPCC
jgi:hypothetical protein